MQVKCLQVLYFSPELNNFTWEAALSYRCAIIFSRLFITKEVLSEVFFSGGVVFFGFVFKVCTILIVFLFNLKTLATEFLKSCLVALRLKSVSLRGCRSDFKPQGRAGTRRASKGAHRYTGALLNTNLVFKRRWARGRDVKPHSFNSTSDVPNTWIREVRHIVFIIKGKTSRYRLWTAGIPTTIGYMSQQAHRARHPDALWTFTSRYSPGREGAPRSSAPRRREGFSAARRRCPPQLGLSSAAPWRPRLSRASWGEPRRAGRGGPGGAAPPQLPPGPGAEGGEWRRREAPGRSPGRRRRPPGPTPSI